MTYRTDPLERAIAKAMGWRPSESGPGYTETFNALCNDARAAMTATTCEAGRRVMNCYDMRRPSKPDYADALNVTVRRRSFLERLHAARWLLFTNWRNR